MTIIHWIVAALCVRSCILRAHYLFSSWDLQSILCFLLYTRLIVGWQICIDTASYHQVYMCCVQTWWKCRSCEYGYVIRVLILLLFIYYLTGIDECQATVQKVIISQKSKKIKRISAYDWYEFSWIGMHKLVQVRNRCRNVWIMSLYIYHSKRIFSVFRL